MAFRVMLVSKCAFVVDIVLKVLPYASLVLRLFYRDHVL